MRRLHVARLLASSTVLLLSAEAFAEAELLRGFGGPAGFGSGIVAPNDDGSSPEIDLSATFPAGLIFFQEEPYFSLWVNNNGSVSFLDDLSTYTPEQIPLDESFPMIAPYWADIDTRNRVDLDDPSENLTYYHVDAETGRFIVTWYETGYYNSHNDLRMSFQLILTARHAREGGDFDSEFRYNRCEWTTGDASDGDGGFGGTPAQAGFDAGNGEHFQVLPYSFTRDVLRLCDETNVPTRPGNSEDNSGIWRFQLRKGKISTCGDGLTQEGEYCDDGGIDDGDGCSADCGVEVDADFDGIFDEFDNCVFVRNSEQTDTDGDWIGDFCDVCPAIADPSQADADEDSLGDLCDTCPGDKINDPDGDSICGQIDVCPFVHDPSQLDGDADGDGDLCDPCPGTFPNDPDADALCGEVDNCPFHFNPMQEDGDGDLDGDACDTDLDGDGRLNAQDNCPRVSNYDQRDVNFDEIGDACARDIDGDSFENALDNCATIYNPSQSDLDRDGKGDWCDPDADGDVVSDDGNSSAVIGDFYCDSNVLRDCDDNCRFVPNRNQLDADANGVGDACEFDVDGDGAANNLDNCPQIGNIAQSDFDLDGIGDPCDSDADGDGAPRFIDCADLDSTLAGWLTIYADTDGDGRGDVRRPENICGATAPEGWSTNGRDNCALTANGPDFADSDADGIGDACDGDADEDDVPDDGDGNGIVGDGVCAHLEVDDCDDNCQFDSNPGQADNDADGLGDACDRCAFSAGPAETFGCPEEVETDVVDDLGTPDAAGGDTTEADASSEAETAETVVQTSNEGGCSAAPRSSGPAALWLLALVLARRRRQQA